MATIRETITAHVDALAASGQGYNQERRTTLLDRARRVIVPRKACDCITLSVAGWYLAGININQDTWSGAVVEDARKVNAGVIDVSTWTLDQIRSTMKPGDILRGEGHGVIVRGDGRVLSAESDENGRASGGLDGDQTGREVVTKALYDRSKAGRPGLTGWTHILQPPGADDAVATPTPKPTASFSGVLSLWSRGDAVGRLQGKLKARYAYAKALAVDNIYGPNTRDVVAEYQRRIGAEVDGQWGPETNRLSQEREGWSL